MNKLAIIVPSRGRPGNLERLHRALTETCHEDWTLYVRLDHDDPMRDSYPQGDRIVYVIGFRTRFVASANELARFATDDGATHLAVFGDDVLPETLGWDTQLISALGGKIGVAYGSDGLEHLHGADLPTHVVIPAEIYRRLGWVALPQLRHLFADNVWRELGRGVGNFVYLPAVKLSHLHRWNGAAPDDQTYQEANDKRQRAGDKAAYEKWRRSPAYVEAVEALTA